MAAFTVTCPHNDKQCAQFSYLFGCWYEKGPVNEDVCLTLVPSDPEPEPEVQLASHE